MFKTIRSQGRSQISLVTGSKIINGDNLNNVKREAGRYFRNKKREYL
jgi:hypothetical protein